MRKVATWLTAVALSGLLLLIKPPARVLAQEPEAGASAQLKSSQLPLYNQQVEQRARILREYLRRFNSPLAPHALDFVQIAERYNLDWRLLPAIAGAESTFGRRIPYGSFNPFGWNNGTYRFRNWKEAIHTVGVAMRKNYIDKWGATTIDQIAPIYAPPSKTWAKNVRFFMQDMENFEKNRTTVALRLSL